MKLGELILQNRECDMTKECRLCEIIKTRKGNFVVYEDDEIIAILDAYPIFKGHTLLLPKKHFDNFYVLPKKLVAYLFTHAQKICIATEKALDADGTLFFINNKVCRTIPHCHIHIIPRKVEDCSRDYLSPRLTVSDTEMRNIQNKIKKAFKALSTQKQLV
jgi:histidine triad (HIT) family protein